jgi:hypothetical protein
MPATVKKEEQQHKPKDRMASGERLKANSLLEEM